MGVISSLVVMVSIPTFHPTLYYCHPRLPSTLGTAALLLGQQDRAYNEAARRQAAYLVNRATRFTINATHSAISHRNEPAELWGDFVYMVPPFLAYYGVAADDLDFLVEAVQQCRLYNEILGTTVSLVSGETCRGLWRHIVSEMESRDEDVWLTSNAWAVAGMTRVLATISKWRPPVGSNIQISTYEEFLNTAQRILTEMIISMLTCAMKQPREPESGLLRNYLDGPSHKSSKYAFGDSAGTALLASAVYRLAVLVPDVFATRKYLEWAHASREAVARHVDITGKVSPVADVSHVPSKRAVDHTSEGQSMALLLYSAWRDCVSCGICEDRGKLWNHIMTLRRRWSQV
jgi:rhamnogalacturonyl hydrolase YesR